MAKGDLVLLAAGLLLYGGCVACKNTVGRVTSVKFEEEATVFNMSRPLNAIAFSAADERFTYIRNHDATATVSYYRYDGITSGSSITVKDGIDGDCDGRVDSIERILEEQETSVVDDKAGTVFQKQPLLAYEAQNAYEDALRRFAPKIEKEFKQYGVQVKCQPAEQK